MKKRHSGQDECVEKNALFLDGAIHTRVRKEGAANVSSGSLPAAVDRLLDLLVDRLLLEKQGTSASQKRAK